MNLFAIHHPSSGYVVAETAAVNSAEAVLRFVGKESNGVLLEKVYGLIKEMGYELTTIQMKEPE